LRILKGIRNFKLVTSVVLRKHQRNLIRYSYQHLVNKTEIKEKKTYWQNLLTVIG